MLCFIPSFLNYPLLFFHHSPFCIIFQSPVHLLSPSHKLFTLLVAPIYIYLYLYPFLIYSSLTSDPVAGILDCTILG